MPLYAPFGLAIFGETLFGVPPSIYVTTRITITPVGYDALQLDWQTPGGNWNEMVLVRSSYGIPISISEGTILFDVTSKFPSQWVDSGLTSGRFYYYTLFVFDTDLDQMVVAGWAQGLVLIDWGFANSYTQWLPDWYLEQDSLLAKAPSTSGPLQRYLNLLGYEMDWIRTEIESFLWFSNIDLVSGQLLPFLGANYGMQYEPQLGMARSRALVKNAIAIYKSRGTLGGAEAAASAYTGFGCEASIGKNLEIQLDDSVFDRSVGHWFPGNNFSTISTVAVSTIPITSEHQTKTPVAAIAPAFANLNPHYTGYLPTNNDNVAQISSGRASGSQNWIFFAPPNDGVTPYPFGRDQSAMAYSTASTEIIMFGGRSSTTADYGDTWAWNNYAWSNVTPSAPASPTASNYPSVAYDSVQGKLVYFGGTYNGGGYSAETWTFNGTSWVQMFPLSSPPPREGAVMHYDAHRSVIVLFGGLNGSGVLRDTWEYTTATNTWVQKTPATSPPARWGAASAYDPVNFETFLFGGVGTGGYLGDLWQWNGTTWTLVTSSGPTARFAANMVWDLTDSVFLLFGGIGSGGALNDTWNFTGLGWVQRTYGTNPVVRYGASMVWDSSHNYALLFGGIASGGTSYLNDTWKWTLGAGWQQLSPAATPPARGLAPLGSFFLLLYGGFNGGGNLFDGWEWTGTNWSLQAGLSSPLSRHDHAMAYHASSSKIVLFGGFSDIVNAYLADTWTWTGGAWTNATPFTASPSTRIGMAMAGDTVHSTVVLFGGQDNTGTIKSDTWTWGGTSWTQLTPATTPPARTEHTMAWDPASNTVIMFGGLGTGGTLLNDTWSWNGTNWTLLSPATSPTARMGAVMDYDTSLSQMVLFGGNGSSTVPVYLNDTWAWNGTTWSQSAVATTPGARVNATAAYDAAQSAFVMFGGFDSLVLPNILSDTWVYTQQPISAPLILRTASMANAPVLGIPILNASLELEEATPQAPDEIYVLSAYFQPLPQATPVLRSFYMQIDWYGLNGAIIGHSAGAPVTEIAGQWVRAYVTARPPVGALTFGRSVYSTGNLIGDVHFMDAEQVELNTQATPGPTSWDPPRDIKLYLVPERQNLIPNPVGLAGTFGWFFGGGTFVSSAAAITWPGDTSNGFLLTLTSGSMTVWASAVSGSVPTIPVPTPGIDYTWSFYINPLTTSAINVFLQLLWYDAGLNFISSVNTAITPNPVGVFTRFSVTGEAPTNAAFVIPEIILAGSNTNQFYLGATMLEPSSMLNPYFDANFSPSTDYLFEGTPNESTSDYYPLLQNKVARLIEIMPDYIPIGSTFSIGAAGATGF